MVVRANVILTETRSYNSKSGKVVTKTRQLIFYRQNDGHPDGILPVLQVFMKWISEGRLRNKLGQCGGWLTILGAIEYNNIPKYLYFKERLGFIELNALPFPRLWRCGSFEPATSISGDIDYLYEIDISLPQLITKKVSYEEDGKQVFELQENRQGNNGKRISLM
jgi:hypothetical protein